jgi:hypothetical protein
VSLTAVSCATTTFCAGVGYFDVTQSGGVGGRVGRTAWHPPTNPGGGAYLSNVTCPAVGLCMTAAAHGLQNFELALVGSTWQFVGMPSLQTGSALTSLSCRTGAACVAVGNYSTSTGANTLVEGRGVTLAAHGYRLVASDGGVFCFTAPFKGSMGGTHLNAPIVGIASDLHTGGYWLVASDGGVFAFTAPFLGSMGGTHLNAPIVGMAAKPTGTGYWLVASDGGIFAFTAPFKGSMGAHPLNQPIVGMAAAPTSAGYWLVAADGGIFAFDAPFLGSGSTAPRLGPVVGMATDPTVGGYWIVTAVGHLVEVGQEGNFSTLGGITVRAPVVGIVDDPGTGGYWMVASDGGVFGLNAPFLGSMGGTHLVAPVVAGAAA